MENFELSPEHADPSAQLLLQEDFYWSFEEETGPFGTDNAYNVFYSFLEWRADNDDISPVSFLHEYMTDIGYPELDLEEANEEALHNYADRYKPVDSELDEEMIAQVKAHAKQKAEEEGTGFDEQSFLEILTGVKSTSGITFIADIDNLIITTAFGQFVLEGEVDEDLLVLTRIAIQRELLQMLLNLYDEGTQKQRKAHLNNMLSKLEEMG